MLGTQYQPDGLPEISGGVNFGGGTYLESASGACSLTYYAGNAYAERWYGNNNRGFTFRASAYNNIYGNSNYVQPKSVSTLPIIKY